MNVGEGEGLTSGRFSLVNGIGFVLYGTVKMANRDECDEYVDAVSNTWRIANRCIMVLSFGQWCRVVW